METEFLKTTDLPFCKGCGHRLISINTAIALQKIGIRPLDTVLVTDIGCHGIVDKSFNVHTMHGLHGRSVALAAGVSMGLSNPNKKVIVFIGDGGVTIGLQHILEAARLNIDMTVVVHNNMLYGMTGGQASGLTPCNFKTSTTPEGNPFSNYDICALAHSAGARYVRRIIGRGNFSDVLAEAIKTPGFSLVEVIEVCPSYGVKFNKGKKINELLKRLERNTGIWVNEDREAFKLPKREKFSSLFEEVAMVELEHESKVDRTYSIVLGGSAGEGVQRAAEFFALAAVKSGLNATKKGSYPVTVGVGFSTAEIIVSDKEIHFNGILEPDIAIMVSKDGLLHNLERIKKMKKGLLLIDESLSPPETGAKIISKDFRKLGPRNAAIFALFFLADYTGMIPISALTKVVQESKLSGKIPIDEIKKHLSSEK